MATRSSNNDTSIADHNRALRLSIIREWDRLLTEATKPDAKGTVGIEIPFKDGRLGEPKVTRVFFGCHE